MGIYSGCERRGFPRLSQPFAFVLCCMVPKVQAVLCFMCARRAGVPFPVGKGTEKDFCVARDSVGGVVPTLARAASRGVFCMLFLTTCPLYGKINMF